MDKAKIAKFGTKVAITAGMGLTLPMLAPIAAPYVATLMAGVLTKDLLEEIGAEGIKAIGGIFGNLAASHLWEAREAVAKSPENQDLLRLLANAYLEAIKDFEVSEEAREQANRSLPLVQNRIKKAIDTKRQDDLLLLFPLDKNSQKGDLKYSFANRLTSEDIILQMADESFSEDDLFADEIELSIRRWYAEEKAAETQKEIGYTILGLSASEQIPEPLISELREQLSKSIPKKIGELVKNEEFNRSWIAFQRLHLQALLKEVHNKQNGLSDEDREYLKPLAEKLDRLSRLEGVPEEIAKISGDMMVRFDNLEMIIETNQTALLDAIKKGEERLLKEIEELRAEVKRLSEDVRKGNLTLQDLRAAIEKLTAMFITRFGEAESFKEAETLKLAIDNLGTKTKISEISKALDDVLAEIKTAVKQVSLPDNIPPSIENFVGREEYLTPLLKEYQKGARCFVLHGIGGVGKTEIAKRFIEKIASEYEAKVYVEMLGMSDNPYSAEKAMFEVIRQFEPKISADISYEQLKGIFAQFVQHQPTLIFLDNAEDKSAVEDLKQARACLIVTSREAFTLTDKDGGIHIGMMTAPDARNLLYEIAGEERFADGEADELAKLAGYLPMALRPIAALLAEDEFETAGRLINSYRDRQKFLEAKVPDYYARTVAASFDLSYKKLSGEMQSRWRRLSVFPSEFDEAAIAAVLDISAEEADDTQKKLRRLSLLDGNAETRRFSLHDLVREYTRAKLAADEKFQTEFLFAKHYASILLHARTMQENREENYYVKALKLIDSEWDNITAGQKYTTQFTKDNDSRFAELCIDYCTHALYFIMLRLHPRQLIEWLEFGIKAAQIHNDNKVEGKILGNLGIIYKNLGEYQKAIEYHEQSIEISQQYGERHGESNSLTNLGLTYSSLGNFQKAVEYHEQALKIKYEINDHFYIGGVLVNLGLAYLSLGDYRKAIECQEKALEIFHQNNNLLGEDTSLGNLGEVYAGLGEYRKAIEYFEQALAISYKIGNRVTEGSNLGNLGSAYYSLGEKEKACGLWKDAVAIFEAIESPFAKVFQEAIEENCH